MEKKFTRFVINTDAHPRGPRIKVRGVITKVYDEEGIFSHVKKPYIMARPSENETEVDIEGTDSKKFMPMHHHKLVDGNIVKKTEQEIADIETQIAESKAIKLQESIDEKTKIDAAKATIEDETKTDKEKLDAVIVLLKGD